MIKPIKKFLRPRKLTTAALFSISRAETNGSRTTLGYKSKFDDMTNNQPTSQSREVTEGAEADEKSMGSTQRTRPTTMNNKGLYGLIAGGDSIYSKK